MYALRRIYNILRGGYVVMLWTIERGDAGSKLPIAVTELGNFVHLTFIFLKIQ